MFSWTFNLCQGGGCGGIDCFQGVVSTNTIYVRGEGVEELITSMGEFGTETIYVRGEDEDGLITSRGWLVRLYVSQ